MDPFSIMGLIGGGASALGGLANLFGSRNGKKNPGFQANQSLKGIPGQVLPYLNPYMEQGPGSLSRLNNYAQSGQGSLARLYPYEQTGQESLGTLKGKFGELLNNPGDVYNKLGSGYTQSPGYQAKLREAMAGANNAYASSGQLGTPQHERVAAQAAGDVAGKDFEDYLTHVLGLYQGGLSGTQDLERQGYGASGDLAKMGYGATKDLANYGHGTAEDYASLLANVGQQRAGYNYAGQAGQNQQSQQGMSNLFGGLGQAGMSYFGGPAMYDMYQKYLTGGH